MSVTTPGSQQSSTHSDGDFCAIVLSLEGEERVGGGCPVSPA
jgi:hypothetical protein